jgi:toxin secretion/phage lysis holin
VETGQFGMLARTGLAGLGAFVGYVWGEWTVLLQVLTFMVIADYVTGVFAGFIEGKLASKAGFKGIAKKMAIFIFVAVGHFIDRALGDGSMVMDAVITFYIGNELISIIENGGRIGLPIPSVLLRAVEIFKEKAEGDKK